MNQLKTVIAGAQILFVAFGAMVFVPLLTRLDPVLALLGAGLGTLLFQLVTKRRVPIFLGFSFTFITPITYSIKEWGLSSAMPSLFAAGLIYSIFAALIRWHGLDAVHKLLSPTVISPVIMVIGSSVAIAANSVAIGQSGDKQVIDCINSLILPGLALAVTVVVSVLGNKMMKLIPILAGVAPGYVLILIMGLVDIGTIIDAPWFAVPHFETPQVSWQVALFMLPVAIAPVIGRVDGIMAIGNVTGKNYTKDPGLDKTFAGDGLDVCMASLIGGPPVATYSEVTGAAMTTRNGNPAVMTWAATFVICTASFGKFNAFLASIPMSVMGGIMLLLFDTIASLGIRALTDVKVDLMQPKDLVIVNSVLITGVDGMIIKVGTLSFAGVGLYTVLAIILSCVLSNIKSEEA